MVLSIYGIQRDEGTWQDAEVFRPSRFLDSWPRYGFIPFGLGRHIYIGSRFSILESMLILACGRQRFRFAQADQEEVNPEVGVLCCRIVLSACSLNHLLSPYQHRHPLYSLLPCVQSCACQLSNSEREEIPEKREKERKQIRKRRDHENLSAN